MTSADLQPWMDRAGRFSALRMSVFLMVIAPAGWLGWLTATGGLGVEPFKAATHLTGEWALWGLLIALAVSPLRRLLGWSTLIGVRRMVGVSAFAYVLGHFGLYVLYQNGDLVKVASEIVSRSYLSIGFFVLVGMAALTATSFDAAIRRMGGNWHRLHRLIYPLTALGIVHFFMQAKVDVADAAMLAGVFVGLIYHRMVSRSTVMPEIRVLIIAVLAGASAAGLEYLWHLTLTGLPADRVFLSNFDFEWEVRHPWLVMAIMTAPLPAMAAQRIMRVYPRKVAHP
ncbi:MAG: protein-methionine-sulfoxide reductase heme-binding subunit MsrQ [Pseudomonadota bacterium]